MTYFMANMIPMGLPLAMLLAAIMTMGNLGENYELLAMKSAGMSLVKITKPLIILVSIISVGSFFIGNDLVPSANKLYSTLYDIKQQKQALEFQDGLFFNGIDNMSIRVSHQDPDTHLLHDVLIYDNRAANNNMNTILADSGYIRLSDDKRFLLVTLFHGETYEQTPQLAMVHQKVPCATTSSTCKTGHPDGGVRHGAHRCRPVQQQQHEGYQRPVARHRLARDEEVNTATKAPPTNRCSKERIFSRQHRAAGSRQSEWTEPVPRPGGRGLHRGDAHPHEGPGLEPGPHDGKSSRNTFRIRRIDHQGGPQPAIPQQGRMAQETLAARLDPDLLPDRRPAGRHHPPRRSGTAVVVSVIFFVIYYIISITGEKLAKEGAAGMPSTASGSRPSF